MKIVYDQPRGRAKLLALGVSAAMLAVLGGFAYYRTLGPQDVANSGPRQAAAGKALPTPTLPAPATEAAATATSGASAIKAAETQGERIDRLIRSGTSDGAYLAYQLIERCLSARAHAVQVAAITDPEKRALVQQASNAQESCREISAGQLTQRAGLLVRAAEGLVPGAFEQLPSLADDPVLAEAAPRLIDAYVKAAIPIALISQYQYAIQCSDPPECKSHDPERALMLWTAYRDVKNMTGDDSVTNGLVKELGPQRARESIERGKLLVADSRRKP